MLFLLRSGSCVVFYPAPERAVRVFKFTRSGRGAPDKQEGFAKDGRFDLEGFKNVLRLRAEYEGGTPAAPEKYLDLSYYQEALKGM